MSSFQYPWVTQDGIDDKLFVEDMIRESCNMANMPDFKTKLCYFFSVVSSKVFTLTADPETPEVDETLLKKRVFDLLTNIFCGSYGRDFQAYAAYLHYPCITESNKCNRQLICGEPTYCCLSIKVPHAIVMFNDEVHSYEDVISTLSSALDIDTTCARLLSARIDRDGCSVVFCAILESLFCQALLNVKSPTDVVLRNCFANSMLIEERKLWKGARIAVQQLIMCTLTKDETYRQTFAYDRVFKFVDTEQRGNIKRVVSMFEDFRYLLNSLPTQLDEFDKELLQGVTIGYGGFLELLARMDVGGKVEECIPYDSTKDPVSFHIPTLRMLCTLFTALMEHNVSKQEWMVLPVSHSPPCEWLMSKADEMSQFSSGRQRLHTVLVAEDYLQLFIMILGERWTRGVGEVKKDDALRRLVVQMLCQRPATFSAIDDFLGRDGSEDAFLEDILSSVANFQESASSRESIFSLKSELLPEYNKFNWFYTKKMSFDSYEYQQTLRTDQPLDMQACPPPMAPKFKPAFVNLLSIYASDTMILILQLILRRKLLSLPLHSDGQLERAIFLIGMALNDEFRQWQEYRPPSEGEQVDSTNQINFTDNALSTTMDGMNLLQMMEKLVGDVIPSIDLLLKWAIARFKAVDALKKFKKEGKHLDEEYAFLIEEQYPDESSPDEVTKEEERRKQRHKNAMRHRQNAMLTMKNLSNQFVDKNQDMLVAHAKNSIEEDDVSFELRKLSKEEFPVAIGPDQSETKILESCTAQCVVCLETTSLSDSSDSVVFPMFMQLSRIFCNVYERKVENKYNWKYPLYVPFELNYGLYANACGHPLHFTCFKDVYHFTEISNDEINLKDYFQAEGYDVVVNGTAIACKKKRKIFINTFMRHSRYELFASILASDELLNNIREGALMRVALEKGVSASDERTVASCQGPVEPRNDRNALFIVAATVAYTLRSLEHELQLERKPLFGAFSKRQCCTLYTLTNSVMLYAWVTPAPQMKIALNEVLQPWFSPSESFTILDIDLFTSLVQVILFPAFCFPTDVHDMRPIPTFGYFEHQTFLMVFTGYLLQALWSTCNLPSSQLEEITAEQKQSICHLECDAYVQLSKMFYNIASMDSPLSNFEQAELFKRFCTFKEYVRKFLRLSALFFNALTRIVPPEALRNYNVDDFQPLCRYLGLPENMVDLMKLVNAKMMESCPSLKRGCLSPALCLICGEGCLLDGPYRDKFGEHDLFYRRGKPLTLREDKYEALKKIWYFHNVPEKITSSDEAHHLSISWTFL
ncbi:putative ATP-dependent Clp protease adaptor protein ClpS [Trichinella spiralis]|uniref:putative ATP-dependent Clp protease adaptor protein ClpS n=1 Tax=Trichinella spiralis TaxID=6334 RepID=UPI0001EFBCFB|nr:putative ATP-dependent Clp protease adaptor protein ClpS [Trichinella spiralis]